MAKQEPKQTRNWEMAGRDRMRDRLPLTSGTSASGLGLSLVDLR